MLKRKKEINKSRDKQYAKSAHNGAQADQMRTLSTQINYIDVMRQACYYKSKNYFTFCETT